MTIAELINKLQDILATRADVYPETPLLVSAFNEDACADEDDYLDHDLSEVLVENLGSGPDNTVVRIYLDPGHGGNDE